MSLAQRFMDVLLPRGGCVMAFAEMYFDESEDLEHNLLCVAGYLFKKEKAVALEQKWASILAEAGLTHFHMVEAAHFKKGLFKGWEKERIEKLQLALFNTLKDHIESGIAISFDMRYRNQLPSAVSAGIKMVSPYSLCSYFCLMHGRWWAKNNSFDGKIGYFFEGGHANKGELGKIMRSVFSVPELRRHYAWGGDAFLDKKSSGALQCADILAWQWAKNVKDRMRGNMKTRKDLFSLLEKPHFAIHFDRAKVKEFREVVKDSNKQSFAKRAHGILQKYGV